MMTIEILKSKIHNAFVTDQNINASDSIGINEKMMNELDILDGELVHIINHRNGERLTAHATKISQNKQDICVNGAITHKVKPKDKIIIIAYISLPFEKAKLFKPKIIFPKSDNSF